MSAVSTKANNVFNTLKNLNEGFVSYMILAMILTILFIVITYIIRITQVLMEIYLQSLPV